MPSPAQIGITHGVLALAREGMWQSAFASLAGLTHTTVNHILQRHAATGTLVPGKSTGAPRKTPPRQDFALFRIVRQDTFKSAGIWAVWLRNLYEMRAGGDPIDSRLLFRGYCGYRPTRTPSPLLTANHRRLCLERALKWQSLTMAHWHHVIFNDKSRFQLNPVDGRLRVRCYLMSASSKGARLIGSKLVEVRYTSGGLFTVVLNRILCSPTDTSELYTVFLRNTLVPLPDSISGIISATKTIVPHLTMLR